MYVTDLRHFLDAAGAIGPTKGPARAMAQFHADVVAHASNPTGQAAPAPPRCFKCKKSRRRRFRRRRCHRVGLPEMLHRRPHFELAGHVVGYARPTAGAQLTEA